MSKDFQPTVEIFFIVAVKIEVYLSIGKLWGEACFWETKLIHHLWTLTALFCLFGENFLDTHICNLLVNRKILRESFLLFRKLLFFCIFRSLRNVHQPFGTFFRQGCRKCCLCVHRNILREVFALESYVSPLVRLLTESFSANSPKYLMRLSKLQPSCTDEHFRAKQLRRIPHFLSFPAFEKKLFKFFSKLCVLGFVKIAFCISRGKLWRPLVFY